MARRGVQPGIDPRRLRGQLPVTSLGRLLDLAPETKALSRVALP